jgi:hypothetical protein
MTKRAETARVSVMERTKIWNDNKNKKLEMIKENIPDKDE